MIMLSRGREMSIARASSACVRFNSSSSLFLITSPGDGGVVLPSKENMCVIKSPPKSDDLYVTATLLSTSLGDTSARRGERNCAVTSAGLFPGSRQSVSSRGYVNEM